MAMCIRVCGHMHIRMQVHELAVKRAEARVREVRAHGEIHSRMSAPCDSMICRLRPRMSICIPVCARHFFLMDMWIALLPPEACAVHQMHSEILKF